MLYTNPILVLVGIAGALGIILALADHYFVNYGECHIKINNDKDITIKGGNSLLSGLIANKIFLPSACGGRATCGFCRCTVKSGGGPLLPTELPFLSKQEIRNNVRISCQIKVKSDVDMWVSETMLSVKEFNTRVEKINDLTHDIKEIIMKIETPNVISFKPGQYVQFKIPNTNEFRAYSVASKPSQKDYIELIARLIPEGVCTTYMHHVLKEGDEAVATGPYGDFYLQENSTKDIICIAGGSGLAPIKSIVFHLFEKGTDRNVIFFFGSREARDLYYRKEFEALAKKYKNFRYVPAISNPSPSDNWTGETGYIHLCIEKYVDKETEKEAYLCGPPLMIDAAVETLYKLGVKHNDIFFDKF